MIFDEEEKEVEGGVADDVLAEALGEDTDDEDDADPLAATADETADKDWI